jgi:transcriptional regulator with XRE-family HTH domain
MDVTPGAALLRQARLAAGLSQRALAERVGCRQPNVSETESGRHDPLVGTLDRYVRAAGGQLAVLPTTTPTVADAATKVAEHLAAGSERRAYRTIIGLHDDLVSSDPAIRVALCVGPPPLVGDRRFDALVAAVVEHDLGAAKLPIPQWVSDPSRDAGGWFVEDLPALHEVIRAATPPAFVRHGVWIDGAELESV